jgi:hypothetical protein
VRLERREKRQEKGERRGKEIRDMWRKETGDEGHRRHQQ